MTDRDSSLTEVLGKTWSKAKARRFSSWSTSPDYPASPVPGWLVSVQLRDVRGCPAANRTASGPVATDRITTKMIDVYW